MTDRKVRRLFPEPKGEEVRRIEPFSAFADYPNIVLLGDPGSGKSHLFREAAEAVGGLVLKARAFLNIPSLDGSNVLFIDALDERRAGRSDQDTIDAIVRKLFDVLPPKVRISCRAQDWLGETDLAAFQPYFDRHGGTVVLGLDVLSEDEQKEVLRAQGTDTEQAVAFLTEARDRGLDEFLHNPQNLIMLCDVVRGGVWPDSRKELFERSTDLLLTEPNLARSRSGTGSFIASELRTAAGGICAARLISDVEGISLTDQDSSSDCPSYRSIDFLDREKVQAALGRRVFVADPVRESADYVHRTTAEFLGAAWLADQVRKGLPMGRVRALMGIDGHPAAELRGLHAWLAVVLPEHADFLIDADPYGILTYGDSGSLTPSLRQRLLDALARLSETDPWFRAGNWHSPALGALARSDMVGPFQRVLRSETASFGLRSIVVDALAAGVPLPELRNDLLAILRRQASPYAERWTALNALLRMGAETKKEIGRTYQDGIGIDPDSLRLRSEITARLNDEFFSVKDIVLLLRDALACDQELPTGAFRSLERCLPRSHIADILDQFPPIEKPSAPTAKRRNVWEVASILDRLLLRALREAKDEIPGESVWRWLQLRRSFSDSYHGGTSKELQQELHRRPPLLLDLMEAFFQALAVDRTTWRSVYDFRESTLHAIGADDLAEFLVGKLHTADLGSEELRAVYELALSLSHTGTSRGSYCFDQLYALGEVSSELAESRDRAIICVIPDWHAEHLEERARKQIDDQQRREANAAAFRTNESAIRAGSHLDLVSWAAKIYLGVFCDVDRKASAFERLASELGDANAQIAIEGFMALVPHKVPSLAAVVEISARHQIYGWWFGLVAGMEESWKRTPNVASFTDEVLRVMLAIDLASPTSSDEDDDASKVGFAWKTAVISQRPDLMRDAYLAVARASLKLGLPHGNGVYELLNNEALAIFRNDVIIELLRDFPNAPSFPLMALLRSALADLATRIALIPLSRDVVARSAVEGDARDVWIVAAYLSSPDEFQDTVQRRFGEESGLVWLVRDLAGYERRHTGAGLTLRLKDLELIVRCAGRHFQDASHPDSGWSGDTNAWDAAEFIRTMVNEISADPRAEAAEVLERLARDDDLASYRDHIKHALAGQKTRRRESEYHQPDWRETIKALSNGPPTSASDLHALLVAQLADLKQRITATNTDIYKRFWNEDSYAKITKPKREESCRDVLVDLLRTGFSPLGVIVDPEVHMASDKRADISVALEGRKVFVELKKDHHTDVWSAAEAQLDRFYTRDPEASGFGVYGVFWFGEKRPSNVPEAPSGLPAPKSASEMEHMLRGLLPSDKRSRLEVVVIDVSGVG